MRRLILFTLFPTLLLATPLAAQNSDAAREFQKLARVYHYLSGLYVDEVDMAPIVEGAIEGMLGELDPHSAYIGAEEMQGVQESFDGEFSGIGVEFNLLRDTVIVVNTVSGGPAERVGMRANDDNAALAAGAGLNRAPSGFMAPRDLFLENVCSNVDGIFYAGAVTAPKNIGETLNEGIAAADAAARYVGA